MLHKTPGSSWLNVLAQAVVEAVNVGIMTIIKQEEFC